MYDTAVMNNEYKWISSYKEMDNSTYNSMEILIDNIIYKSQEFCNPLELQELNNVLDKIMSKYQLLKVNENNIQLNHTEENDELINKFLQAKSFEGCSPRTIQAYQSTIDKFLEWVDKRLNEISPEDVRAYLKYKMTVDNVSNSYADTILRYLRTCFKWLSDESYVYLNPTASIPKIRSKRN